MKRRISVALTAFIVVISGALFASSNNAYASSTCLSSPSFNNCTGGGPAATGCATGAFVAEEVTGYDLTAGGAQVADSWVKLWYSPACRSTWAQAVSDTSPLPDGYYPYVYVQIKSGSEAGWSESCGEINYQASYGGYECSTPMVYDAGTTSKGYAQAYHDFYADTQELITAAY